MFKKESYLYTKKKILIKFCVLAGFVEQLIKNSTIRYLKRRKYVESESKRFVKFVRRFKMVFFSIRPRHNGHNVIFPRVVRANEWLFIYHVKTFVFSVLAPEL